MDDVNASLIISNESLKHSIFLIWSLFKTRNTTCIVRLIRSCLCVCVSVVIHFSFDNLYRNVMECPSKSHFKCISIHFEWINWPGRKTMRRDFTLKPALNFRLNIHADKTVNEFFFCTNFAKTFYFIFNPLFRAAKL